ncbi:MAG TPA: DUF1444 family protein [Pirellulaceae bacterium]|nr:DUF1444 family protein [Pirellulaceae bacterium]
MGLFEFFSGTPSKDKFVSIVLAELKRLEPEAEYQYDAEKFLLLRPDEGFINLSNVYAEYCQAEADSRPKLLKRFLHSCVATKSYELPEDFDDVHPDLLPVVRSRFYLESAILQSKVRGGEGFDMPQLVIGEHLALSLVYDLPTAMRSISQKDLEAWEVTFYEAVEAARHNLEQMGEIKFAVLDGRVYASASGDNYDASRLVLLDLIRRFEVRGEYIAMVPNRDTLIVTGSDDDEGLAIMAKIAKGSFDKPRPISTVALRLEGDEWLPWLPAEDSPHFADLHELKLRTLRAEYNDQKELLDAVHEQTGESVLVAPFGVLQNKETGRVTSYGVWSEGVECLLPHTDAVMFFRPTVPDDGKIVAGGAWEHVRQVVGDLMEPLGLYPERYRVREFPSEAQIAKIGKGLG